MSILSGLGARAAGLFADNKGPWGPTAGSGEDSPPPDNDGAGPWGEPPKRGRRTVNSPQGNAVSFEEFLRRSKARFGNGGGFPGKPDRSIFVWAALALVLLWLLLTTVHRVAPEERGVITRFGRYSHTLGPGIGLTLPSPIDKVTKIDVENIRTIDLGTPARRR